MKRHCLAVGSLIVSGLLVAGCGNPICSCSPVPRWSTVYGVVTDDTAGPVGGAEVRVLAVREGDTVVAHEHAETGVDGTYRIEFPDDYGGETYLVRAEPGAGTGLDVAELMFTPRFSDGRPPLDSVRVDLTLSPL